MTKIEEMSDKMIVLLCEGYLNGSLTINKPSKPLKGNKDGSLMEQVFYQFEIRNL